VYYQLPRVLIDALWCLQALSPHAEALLDQSPSLSVDHDDDISLDSETLSGGYLGEGVAAPIPVAGGSASMIRRTGSSLSLCLQRTNSLSQVAGSFPAAGTSYPRIGSFIRTSSFLTGSPRSQATGECKRECYLSICLLF